MATITVTRTTAGTTSWLCPPGVTSVNVVARGSGGGGGGVAANTNKSSGGGAGGQYAASTGVSVTPGSTYDLVLGAGGSAGANTGGDGGVGGDATFGTSLVVAKGGAGGQSYENGKAGGNGSLTGIVGTTQWKGGDGGDGGDDATGGGGGEGAGSTSDGGSTTTATGGTGTDGGTGGTGGNNAAGGAGTATGGGGGGAGTTSTTNRLGGAGALGSITITYTTPLMSALTDNFDDNSFDATKWENGLTVWTFPEQNAELEAVGTTSAGNVYVTSKNSQLYDLTSNYLIIKVVDVGNLALTSWRVYIQAAIDSSNFVAFKVNGGGSQNLEAIHSLAGSETVVGSGVAWNATNHLWLKIRESGGTTYWDYSADGVNWTNLASEANAMAVTGLKPVINVFASAEASAATAKFDNFNLPPTGTNIQINIGDAWKDVSGVQINIGDSWKTVTKVQVNIGDVWKTIFG